MFKHVRITLCLLLCLSLFVSCKKDDIRTFKLPKQRISVAQLQSVSTKLQWETPKHWIEKTLTEFRKASFTVPHPQLKETDAQGDFSITSFPGKAGGFANNINRWRSQLLLAPQSKIEIERALKEIPHEQFDIQYIQLNSSAPVLNNKYYKSTLAAFFEFKGETYFFKLSGETSIITAEKRAFVQTLKDIYVQ